VALTDFSSSANYIHAAFDDATKFIDECRAANSAVMVHCVAGISRSTTAVLQYLMKREGWSLKKAYAITKSARTNMRPNKVRRCG
jgi:protein-tyrosine phosphatase